MKAISACVAAAASTLLLALPAEAASDPTGVWFDHNGRGAVEIAPCASGTGLCGYVVNIKDPRNADRCGLQILGNVSPGGDGWIYSPERKRRYDVALKRLSDDKLRVVGNAGSRFFSRTFTWTRAPDDIVRCGETVAAAAPEKAVAAPKPAPLTKDGSEPEKSGAFLPPAATVDLATTSAETAEAAPAPAAQPAEEAAPAVAEEEPATTKRRRCTYRIPYIGRTISAPCRD